MDVSIAVAAGMPDAEVVRRVRQGESALFEILMRRYNQRVYRVARSVVKDETEAEDVMQQAYVNAYVHLDQFEARAQFSTWLVRIAIHEALGRRHRTRPAEPIVEDSDGEPMETLTSLGPDPERQAYAGELRQMLESAVDALPENYRIVFMLRDIEGLSTAEAAHGLEIAEEAVKTRLHRARAMLRQHLFEHAGAVSAGAFDFPATRCDRVVAAVLAALARCAAGSPSPES